MQPAHVDDAVALVAALARPAAQLVHAVAAAPDQLPAAHTGHVAVAAVTLLAVPAAQLAHVDMADAPTAADQLPATHDVGATLARGQKFPAGQVRG